MTLLTVDGLTVRSRHRTLIDRISFGIEPGERVGLIGESGSGKTLTALAILGLLPDGLEASGSIRLHDQGLVDMPENRLCRIRGDQVSMIFQEPMTALNPVMRIGRQIAESLDIHQGIPRADAQGRVIELLEAVGITHAEARARSYPHQLSGGQRQRAMIAMALACGPDLVIADEPTTALDVTVQAQVLAVLARQVATTDTALLLITHDLPVVAGICERVIVMKDGQIVEGGPTRRVFETPQAAHTQSLVRAVPPLSRSAGIPPPPPLAEGDAEPEPMVQTRGVVRTFRLPRTAVRERPEELRAVDDVTIEVRRGETFGIVGESGSGKTTLARLLVGLDRPDAGEIVIDGFNVTAARDLHPLRQMAQIVFQDPIGSLDPRMPVGDVISEPLRSLRVPGDHRARVLELLDAVALPADSFHRYPHEFSGGQRQRIAIARALAPHPRLLVADEPVSALDMSVQTRTLELLAELKKAYKLTMVFISHDLSVVHEICDRVAVMQAGRITESGPAANVFASPQDPYTRRLLDAIPRLDGTLGSTAAR